MGKTLVIAEKPSVGQDYAKALPGSVHQSTRTTWSRTTRSCPGRSATWSSWPSPRTTTQVPSGGRSNRLPIIPEQFKLKPIEGRGKKQLDVLRKLIKRKDVDVVVNGCDAGREGELIFAYIYDCLGSDKPVSGCGCRR